MALFGTRVNPFRGRTQWPTTRPPTSLSKLVCSRVLSMVQEPCSHACPLYVGATYAWRTKGDNSLILNPLTPNMRPSAQPPENTPSAISFTIHPWPCKVRATGRRNHPSISLRSVVDNCQHRPQIRFHTFRISSIRFEDPSCLMTPSSQIRTATTSGALLVSQRYPFRRASALLQKNYCRWQQTHSFGDITLLPNQRKNYPHQIGTHLSAAWEEIPLVAEWRKQGNS